MWHTLAVQRQTGIYAKFSSILFVKGTVHRATNVRTSSYEDRALADLLQRAMHLHKELALFVISACNQGVCSIVYGRAY